MSLKPPILSVADPLLEGEGSIDPLGTGATYERLAEHILPFITARMSRPRFITAMAVGSCVCSGLEERIAADGLSPAWLIFEWYVVEAHARSEQWASVTGRRRMAGIDKVSGAIRRGQSVGHASYLKTPKVFGFTGIYKRLAAGLGILTEDLALDEGGHHLLAAWEQEQGLAGFAMGGHGDGARMRIDLRAAVEAGLAAARTDRPARWALWELIVGHLRPDRAGRNEATWLFERLAEDRPRHHAMDRTAAAMRGELTSHLARHGRPVEIEEEAAFLRGISAAASPELQFRLDVIDAFESFCRPLEDAFRLILHLSTVAACGPVDATDFAGHERAPALLESLRSAVARVQRTDRLLEWEPEVRDLAARYDGVPDLHALFETLLRHHEETQRGKPPDGKRPWFEWTAGNRVVVRQAYAQQNAPAGGDAYVHPYRVASLASFLVDLVDLGKNRT